MVLPQQIKSNRMLGTAAANTIDDLHNQAELALSDIFGIPADTNITKKLFTADGNGLRTVDLVGYTFANLPAAGVAGRMAFVTDNKGIFFDTGTQWVKIHYANAAWWGMSAAASATVNTQAFRAALTALNFEGVLELPAGVIALDDTAGGNGSAVWIQANGASNDPHPQLTIKGQGIDTTKLAYQPSTGGYCFDLDGSAVGSQLQNVVLKDFTIELTSPADGGIIFRDRTTSCGFERINIETDTGTFGTGVLMVGELSLNGFHTFYKCGYSGLTVGVHLSGFANSNSWFGGIFSCATDVKLVATGTDTTGGSRNGFFRCESTGGAGTKVFEFGAGSHENRVIGWTDEGPRDDSVIVTGVYGNVFLAMGSVEFDWQGDSGDMNQFQGWAGPDDKRASESTYAQFNRVGKINIISSEERGVIQIEKGVKIGQEVGYSPNASTVDIHNDQVAACQLRIHKALDRATGQYQRLRFTYNGDVAQILAENNTLNALAILIASGTGETITLQGGATSAQFDNNATATNTRMLLWDVDKGALSRVSVGANDSGGSGFKLLRVPN